MPQESEWLDLIMEDVGSIPAEHLSQIQNESFHFKFEGRQGLPPVLAVVGDGDVAMAKRDFSFLFEMLTKSNERSEGLKIGPRLAQPPDRYPRQVCSGD